MILEWLQSLTTPAPRHIRSLGFVHEAIAIEARYKRCHEAWASHLLNSKSRIQAAVDELETRDRVLVIGSGGLHDLPLNALSQCFTSVTLWDVIHLAKARRTAAAVPNITCETVDVTGLCKDFNDWLWRRRKTPPAPRLPTDLPTGAPNLVISLNLLSQLPLQMVARAKAKGRTDLPGDFADGIIQTHVDWLRTLPCPVLLLTDLERHYKKDGVLEIEDAIPEMDLGTPPTAWMWEIAPSGETTRFDTIHHKVGAFTFNAP